VSYLDLHDVSVSFGGLKALANVAMKVNKGEIFGVIGPNGAGKTTLFNVIAGAISLKSGKVEFEGRNIAGSKVDTVARLGIGRTFQAATVFKKATVAENLTMAADFSRRPFPRFSQLFSASPGTRTPEVIDTARMIDLQNSLDVVAAALPYGHQKMLGVGMALMANPKVIMMDEPAAGLNSSEKVEMTKLIGRIRSERQITVLVVEHDMPLIMTICDRILVLDRGSEIMTGTPTDVQQHAGVINAYLGAPDVDA
jgi:branched-chain amino acid transport system ATP-binding protein